MDHAVRISTQGVIEPSHKRRKAQDPVAIFHSSLVDEKNIMSMVQLELLLRSDVASLAAPAN
jgi:hypothetical protein